MVDRMASRLLRHPYSISACLSWSECWPLKPPVIVIIHIDCITRGWAVIHPHPHPPVSSTASSIHPLRPMTVTAAVAIVMTWWDGLWRTQTDLINDSSWLAFVHSIIRRVFSQGAEWIMDEIMTHTDTHTHAHYLCVGSLCVLCAPAALPDVKFFKIWHQSSEFRIWLKIYILYSPCIFRLIVEKKIAISSIVCVFNFTRNYDFLQQKMSIFPYSCEIWIEYISGYLSRDCSGTKIKSSA